MRPRALVLAVALLAVAAAPARAAGPSPGAAGIGDPLFPGLGNGGYDVQHYDLDLRYATSAPSQPIDGTVTIVARATQALSSFNLDFAGQSIGGVSVDGRPAQWRRDDETTAVANGVPLGHWTRHGRTKWLYVQRQPMATELTQLAAATSSSARPAAGPGCSCAT
jgi:hypothetical protein